MNQYWLTGFLLAALIPGPGLQAQGKISGVGIHIGTNLLVGDSRLEASQLSPGFGFDIIYKVSQIFRVKFQIDYSRLIVENSSSQFQTYFIPVEISWLYFLDTHSPLTPIFQFGIGGMGFSVNNSPTFYDGIFMSGGGFQAPISTDLSFLIFANLSYTTGDDFNGLNHGLKESYFSIQTGLIYHMDKEPKKFHKKIPGTKKNPILSRH